MSYKYNPLLVGKLDRVGAGASRLSELDDVNTAGTVNGKVLTFQSGTWLPEAVAGGGDMLISQYVTGAGTVYNASRLEGETLATVQAHNVAASKVTTGTFNLNRIPSVDDARIPDLETLSYGAAFATGQIPSLPTTKITTGTFGIVRIPTMDDAHIPDLDTLSYSGAFAEAQIPNLPTTKITSGTLGLARIPGTLTGKDADTVDGADAGVAANTVFKIPAGIAQGDIFNVNSGGSIVNLSAGTTGHFLKTLGAGTNPVWESVPGGGDMLKNVYDTGDNGIVDNSERLETNTLATVQAHNVAASKVTTGTFNLNRIPSVDDARIPDLETLSYGAAFATGQIPSLPTTKITTGTFGIVRIPTMDDAHIPDLDTLSYSGAFAEAQIPNLPTTKITSGTLGLARIPGTLTGKDADTVDGADAGVAANTVFKIPAGIAQGDIFNVNSGGSIVNLSAGTTGHFLKTLGAGTNPVWESVPGGGDMLKNVYDTGDNGIVDNSERLETNTLATVQAHNVAASKVTTGTFNLNRIPSVDDARIPDLETLSYGAAFATAQVPAIGAYKTASGTLNADRIPVLPTARYGSAVLVSGTRAMTNAFRLKSNAGTTGMATVDGAIFFDTTADKVKVYVA